MDISIIIPCHNLETWIEPCLKSLCKQENTLGIKREVIFVLDKCTDSTQEIIKLMMNKSDWNYSIIPTNFGCSGYARNAGLESASGKYIWFIDGDDWLTAPNAIDTLVTFAETNLADIVEFKIKSKANPEGIYGEGTVWRALISRNIIGETRFNDRQNGEDNDFSWEIWNKPNAKYFKIDFAPYFYNYPRLGSLSDIAYNTTGLH